MASNRRSGPRQAEPSRNILQSRPVRKTRTNVRWCLADYRRHGYSNCRRRRLCSPL